jgi:transglutaminase-like putative cysteine protease
MTARAFSLPLLSAAALALAVAAVSARPETAPAKTRTFQFSYDAVVNGLAPGQKAGVWLPLAASGDDQDVEIASQKLPAEGAIGRDKTYGNRILYVEARADKDGAVPLQIVYRVVRREVRGEAVKATKEDADLLARFLQPDAKVPIDGKPLKLLEGKELPKDQTETARTLYDLVNGHMRYDKTGTGWGEGDAAWACDSKRGNCTDFHSLFISLARSRKIPAKFEIGFGLPPERGEGEVKGYHCWAKFRPEGKGWIPVDISEANKNPKLTEYYFGNLTEDRVAFSTGRDLALVPKQDGPPLNYFIYPYVEVEGKPWPKDRIKTTFSFKDVK